MDENKTQVEVQKTEVPEVPVLTANDIRGMVYVIRGKQVMLDSDLAKLYGVETRIINQAVKRNLQRFPSHYSFQLTGDEWENLKSQFVISSLWGGRRRSLPYVFTEQGVAMLSAVLKSEVAIEVSIRIMDAFVEMRRFIANNAALFERISSVELKQLEYQKQTDERFEQVFEYIGSHEEAPQKLFFKGQIYDAFSFLVELIQSAERNIKLVDGYVDVNTLNLLAKKNKGVSVDVYTLPNGFLSVKDINKFNAQYPKLTVHKTKGFHDRFLILDDQRVYHIGASLKDAGKKCFGVTLLEDSALKETLMMHLE